MHKFLVILNLQALQHMKNGFTLDNTTNIFIQNKVL